MFVSPTVCTHPALLPAVGGMADLFQSFLPGSKGKINTTDCTSSQGRFGATVQTQSFLLTKVIMASQPLLICTVERTGCFLGHQRDYTAAMISIDAYLFLRKCVHVCCLFSCRGIHSLLTLSLRVLDRVLASL
jgi:hypothetical protein